LTMFAAYRKREEIILSRLESTSGG